MMQHIHVNVNGRSGTLMIQGWLTVCSVPLRQLCLIKFMTDRQVLVGLQDLSHAHGVVLLSAISYSNLYLPGNPFEIQHHLVIYKDFLGINPFTSTLSCILSNRNRYLIHATVDSITNHAFLIERT